MYYPLLPTTLLRNPDLRVVEYPKITLTKHHKLSQALQILYEHEYDSDEHDVIDILAKNNGCS
jgi:hypothetical protein